MATKVSNRIDMEEGIAMGMSRWDVRKLFGKVSHADFLHIGREFHGALEEGIGQKVHVRAELYSAPRAFTTFWDDDIQAACDKENERNLMHETDAPGDVTLWGWRAAEQIRLVFTPSDPGSAPPHMFATAQFKGAHPKRVTFYVQPDEAVIFRSCDGMRERLCPGKFWPGWLWDAGDGWSDHGRRNARLPASLLRMKSRN